MVSIWHALMALFDGCSPFLLPMSPIILSSALSHAARRIVAPDVLLEGTSWGLRTFLENENLQVR